MNLGSRIKALRENIQLTQSDLGKKLGKTKQWVSNVENDKTQLDIDTLYALSEALDCNIMDILPSGQENGGEPSNVDDGMMQKAKEISQEQMFWRAHNASRTVLLPEPESLLKKRESVKTLVDILDEEQLDALMRFLVAPQK